MVIKIDLNWSSKFAIGCNYWASHAGTSMWSDWRPDVIEKDLRKLSEGGLNTLRVFPIWPDFQPINQLSKYRGIPVEIRHGEDPLPDNAMGRAGISAVMIDRFEEFAALADKYGFRLIVGLITGWMSGRLFVPQALEGRDILTDPVSVMWQTRFVDYFVRRFASSPAIAAWDLGNECNCMQEVPDRESAWVWTSTITRAIKSADRGRPVISGMHSLTLDGKWTIMDQGELTDILTTHPYPVFTPYCFTDPANTMKTLLHATAESSYYSDIGRKPCLVEEIGSLGPMVADESVSADFARVNLFSQWAHGFSGFLWWCANDQTNLERAPYDWTAIERELGLLRVDGSAKPVLNEMGQFAKFLEGLPLAELPPRQREAVCILSDNQDHWGVAYASFILSKQAGFDLRFQSKDQAIPKSNLYMLPCISGFEVISRRRWTELLHEVSEGASLYISYEDAFISQFSDVTGMQIQTNSSRTDQGSVVTMRGSDIGMSFTLRGSRKLALRPMTAEVIGVEEDGNPAFSVSQYGKGRIYFLAFPMEMQLVSSAGSFDAETAEPYYEIYRYFSRGHIKRIATCNSPLIGLTEHEIDSDKRIIVAINYSPDQVEARLELDHGWKVEEIYYGQISCEGSDCCSAAMEKNDAAVFSVVRG